MSKRKRSSRPRSRAMSCAEPEEDTSFTQTGELTATAAVLEAGSGRATVKTASVQVHPEKYYIGVKTKATRVSEGETFQVEGMIPARRADSLRGIGVGFGP